MDITWCTKAPETYPMFQLVAADLDAVNEVLAPRNMGAARDESGTWTFSPFNTHAEDGDWVVVSFSVARVWVVDPAQLNAQGYQVLPGQNAIFSTELP